MKTADLNIHNLFDFLDFDSTVQENYCSYSKGTYAYCIFMSKLDQKAKILDQNSLQYISADQLVSRHFGNKTQSELQEQIEFIKNQTPINYPISQNLLINQLIGELFKLKNSNYSESALSKSIQKHIFFSSKFDAPCIPLFKDKVITNFLILNENIQKSFLYNSQPASLKIGDRINNVFTDPFQISAKDENFLLTSILDLDTTERICQKHPTFSIKSNAGIEQIRTMFTLVALHTFKDQLYSIVPHPEKFVFIVSGADPIEVNKLANNLSKAITMQFEYVNENFDEHFTEIFTTSYSLSYVRTGALMKFEMSITIGNFRRFWESCRELFNLKLTII